MAAWRAEALRGITPDARAAFAEPHLSSDLRPGRGFCGGARRRRLIADLARRHDNLAFAAVDADRRSHGRATRGCVDQPAGVLPLVGTHEETIEPAAPGGREPLVAPTIRRNPRRAAQRAAGEGHWAA